MAKSKNCKKASNRKDLATAQATTRANKIRKAEKLLRDCPTNIAVKNQLNQLYYDAGSTKRV
jgi:hypothetical protein